VLEESVKQFRIAVVLALLRSSLPKWRCRVLTFSFAGRGFVIGVVLGRKLGELAVHYRDVHIEGAPIRPSRAGVSAVGL
jgi:hypothetical protein